MDLGRLQDRKKYQKWAKRKNAYTFYSGEAKKKKRRLMSIVISAVVVVILGIALIYNIIDPDLGIIYGDLMVVRQKDLGDHEFQVNEEEVDVTQLAREYLSTMGLSTKIAQLLITTPELLNEIGQVIQAGESTKRRLMEYPVGGLIYSELNFETIEQLQKLVNHTKLFTNYPTFLGIDETGYLKIDNTNHTYEDVGINLDCTSQEYFIIENNEQISMNDLRIEELYGRDPVALLNDGAIMLVIKYSFITNHSKILNAVKVGEITEESIDQKVLKILEYKLKYGVE